MSTTHNPRTDTPPTDAAGDDTVRSAPPTTDGWTPEDRAPSAAESNFMSFALFGFLVLFGIGCFILF